MGLYAAIFPCMAVWERHTAMFPCMAAWERHTAQVQVERYRTGTSRTIYRTDTGIFIYRDISGVWQCRRVYAAELCSVQEPAAPANTVGG